MRKYRANAATDVRLDYGIELCEGLALFPETASLVPVFAAVNDDLAHAQEARRARRTPLVKARVAIRSGNFKVDTTIRSAAKAAEIADGGRRGPIFKAAFPDGVAAVVAPVGARQIPPTEALIDRIQKSKVPGMDAYRDAWVPKLEADLGGLKNADQAHKDAHKAYVGAFGTELALRQEHFLAVDKIAGAVRAAFPGDKAKQDLVFPVVDEAEGNGGEEPAPSDPADGP